MHVVGWGIVCKDKNYDGLGIRRLKILNRAYMFVKVCQSV